MSDLEIPHGTPICIKSHIKDTVTEAFANGCGGICLSRKDFYSLNFQEVNSPIVTRGLNKLFNIKWFLDSKNKKLNYYLIDTGYMGNDVKKRYHRVTRNSLQVSKVIKRPNDRALSMPDFYPKPWKYNGKKILLCPPSEKSLKFFLYCSNGASDEDAISYQECVDRWIEETVKEIRKFSDREIKIRRKPRCRNERTKINTFKECVLDDIFATVTFNSIVAVESIINGVPAFVCAENAASPMSLPDLSRIERPIYPKRLEWINHLSYSQFTVEELFNGTAWKILHNTETKKELKKRIKKRNQKKKNNESFKKWCKKRKSYKNSNVNSEFKEVLSEESLKTNLKVQEENEDFLKILNDQI